MSSSLVCLQFSCRFESLGPRKCDRRYNERKYNERLYNVSFVCQKCLVKNVQYQVAIFQEKIKELAFSKFHLQTTNLQIRIESHKLFICEKHFTADQINVYPSRKSLKEGALLTLNLPRPSANLTNNRSISAIEKREEYSFLQGQLPQPQPSNVYKSFDQFKFRTKSLALNKLWEINIQEQLVIASFTSSEYILPTYEIYINNLLNFTVSVHSWFFPVYHELYLLYNSSF